MRAAYTVIIALPLNAKRCRRGDPPSRIPCSLTIQPALPDWPTTHEPTRSGTLAGDPRRRHRQPLRRRQTDRRRGSARRMAAGIRNPRCAVRRLRAGADGDPRAAAGPARAAFVACVARSRRVASGRTIARAHSRGMRCCAWPRQAVRHGPCVVVLQCPAAWPLRRDQCRRLLRTRCICLARETLSGRNGARDGRLSAGQNAVAARQRQSRHLPGRRRGIPCRCGGVHRHPPPRRARARGIARRQCHASRAGSGRVDELLGPVARPVSDAGNRADRIPGACGNRQRIFPARCDRPASRAQRTTPAGAARRQRMAWSYPPRRPAACRGTARRDARGRSLSVTTPDFRMNDAVALSSPVRDALAAAWGLSPRARFSPLGSGLINRTLLVRDQDGRQRVLQCLNVHVFRDPARVMRNCRVVTAHLGRERAAGRYGYSVLELVPTLAGDAALVLPDGSWWRMYDHVPDAHTFDAAGEPAMTCEAGRAFGAFAAALADLPPGSVGEVIPKFHDPVARFEAWRSAREADHTGRAAQCRAECEAASRFAELLPHWRTLNERGLPARITHNDCKLNNLLFDEHGKAACVVDLDTVMPGSLLFDFGDMARTMLSPVAEDSVDLAQVHVRHD